MLQLSAEQLARLPKQMVVSGVRHMIAYDYRGYVERSAGAYLRPARTDEIAYLAQDLAGKLLGWNGMVYPVVSDVQEAGERTLYMGDHAGLLGFDSSLLIPIELHGGVASWHMVEGEPIGIS